MQVRSYTESPGARGTYERNPSPGAVCHWLWPVALAVDITPQSGLPCKKIMSRQRNQSAGVNPMAVAIHAFFAANGKKGGASRSAAKVAAVQANLAKARANRWKKAKAA